MIVPKVTPSMGPLIHPLCLRASIGIGGSPACRLRERRHRTYDVAKSVPTEWGEPYDDTIERVLQDLEPSLNVLGSPGVAWLPEQPQDHDFLHMRLRARTAMVWTWRPP